MEEMEPARRRLHICPLEIKTTARHSTLPTTPQLTKSHPQLPSHKVDSSKVSVPDKSQQMHGENHIPASEATWLVLLICSHAYWLSLVTQVTCDNNWGPPISEGAIWWPVISVTEVYASKVSQSGSVCIIVPWEKTRCYPRTFQRGVKQEASVKVIVDRRTTEKWIHFIQKSILRPPLRKTIWLRTEYDDTVTKKRWS